jgi:hypothetical protein
LATPVGLDGFIEFKDLAPNLGPAHPLLPR